MFFHVNAILPGGRRKTIINKTEEQDLTQVVIPFESSGIIEAKWGKRVQSYQVIDLQIYKTPGAWDKRQKQSLESFVGKARNMYSRLAKKAQKALGKKLIAFLL